MFYGETVEATRQGFFTAWEKFNNKTLLSPLETQIVDVILHHPEYHRIVTDPANLHKHYSQEREETNPFLHMGLHLAIREQVAINKPHGIAAIYTKLANKLADPLEAEHRLMEVFAILLWESQRDHGALESTVYLARCKALLG